MKVSSAQLLLAFLCEASRIAKKSVDSLGVHGRRFWLAKQQEVPVS